MNIEALYQVYQQFPSVQTDTRLLKENDLFFALKGPNFNANQFAQKAVDAGAARVVIDEASYAIPGKTILCDDVLTTLQALAKFHRSQFDIPFLAITGSNGKTTTKELVHVVLSEKYRTYTTQGNLNNHIGIPLTILRIGKDAEMAVIEMGANHQREIAGYCEYAMPTHGLITNCGKAHLEGFGGIEGVRKGKGELFDYLRAHGGSAFVMWDYDYLQDMSKGIPEIIKYGTRQSDTTGMIDASEPFLSVTMDNGSGPFAIHSHLVGGYNLPNLMAASAIGHYFGVTDALIQSAIESYQPSNSRSQLLTRGTNQVILDAYNANPSSMKLAIENLARLSHENKILLLGGMAELGPESMPEHQDIVSLIGQYPWKEVVLVGGDFLKFDHPYKKFATSADAAQWFRQQNFQNAYILIKGSRSMQMEKILQP